MSPFEIVSFVITHLETSLRDGSSNMTSSSAASMMERSPRAPVSRLQGLLGDLPQRVVGEHELDRVVAEEPLVLACERVLGLGQDLHEIVAAQLVHG